MTTTMRQIPHIRDIWNSPAIDDNHRHTSTPNKGKMASSRSSLSSSRSSSTSSSSSSYRGISKPKTCDDIDDVDDDFGRYLPDDDGDDVVTKLEPSRTTVCKSSAATLSRVLHGDEEDGRWTSKQRGRSHQGISTAAEEQVIDLFNQTINRRIHPRHTSQVVQEEEQGGIVVPVERERRYEKNANGHNMSKVNPQLTRRSQPIAVVTRRDRAEHEKKRKNSREQQKTDLGTVNFSFVRYQNLDCGRPRASQYTTSNHHHSMSNLYFPKSHEPTLATSQGHNMLPAGATDISFQKYDGFDGNVPHPIDLETILTSEGTCRHHHHPHLWNKVKQGLMIGNQPVVHENAGSSTSAEGSSSLSSSSGTSGKKNSYPGMEHFTFSQLATPTSRWTDDILTN